VICQIVVKEEYKEAVVSLAHDSSMTEHLGVSKSSICTGLIVFFEAIMMYISSIRGDY
jgi:hypothetical protein